MDLKSRKGACIRSCSLQVKRELGIHSLPSPQFPSPEVDEAISSVCPSSECVRCQPTSALHNFTLVNSKALCDRFFPATFESTGQARAFRSKRRQYSLSVCGGQDFFRHQSFALLTEEAEKEEAVGAGCRFQTPCSWRRLVWVRLHAGGPILGRHAGSSLPPSHTTFTPPPPPLPPHPRPTAPLQPNFFPAAWGRGLKHLTSLKFRWGHNPLKKAKKRKVWIGGGWGGGLGVVGRGGGGGGVLA